MKQSKAVQVTNHKIRKDQKIVYQLYNTCRYSDIISSYKNNFSCQFDSRRDNGVCTCKNVIKVKQREMRYYSGTPKQIYTCRGSRSITDIGIGRVKVVQRKKVKKVYLPETDDRGVGSSDLSSINRKNKHLNNNSGLRPKSSKCVGGILEYNRECVVNEKLSPIIQTKLDSTSLEWVNTETGTNTVDRRFETIGTQFKYENETEKWPSPNKTKEMLEMRLKVETKLSDKMIIKKTAEERNRIRMERRLREAEIVCSSDSLVQHVHNLENPSDEKQSRSSLQEPMKNKFEREYRKMFSMKSKDSKPVYERPIPEYKSGSILRRRFEALRKSFTKKDELNQEKKDVLVSKDSVAESIQSNKDASVTSDPSSSRARSFSNTIKHFPVVQQERIKTYNVKCKNEPGSGQWPKTSTDSESQGVKGMFKLWGKKFNFEDDSYKKPATPLSSYDKCEKEEKPKVSPAKKEGRKFFFFKKKSKGIKTKESYKSKKDVTAGRYEISGLSLKIESSTRKEEPKVPDEHGDITRETWLRKFLSQSIESARSVNIRWNNNLYATSSSTVFKLLDTVYKNTGVVLKSRSETTTATSIDKSYTKHKVNFVHDIEAWMIPKTIPDRQKRTPFKIKSNKEIRDRNIEVTISDQRWDTDKSEAFAHKIEFVLHSKNAINSIRTTMSSDYLRIDIPKDFFDTSGSDASKGHNQSSDEEVYKIVEYETNSEIRDKKFSKNLCPINQDLPTNNIKLIVSVQDSKNKESNVIETVIKKPTMHRDVLIQGSNVNISQRCDVIGVGVITQRDLREMQKPILQIADDLSDEEEPVIEMNQKKCEFAESYLQDYYRNWTQSGVDIPGVLYSWCVSDTHLRSCSEKSLHSLNNQGDDSKSCSNVIDDCQTSCNNSNCSHGYGEDMVCDSFATKLFRKVISKSNTDKARILPKDSLEVSKKRKIYADVQSRIQWRLAPSKPSSSSISECGDDNRPCKKRVSIDQEGDKKGGKHAIIKPIPSCIIPAPPCQSSCEKKKLPLCNMSIKVPTSSCNMGENSPGARSNLSLGKKEKKDKESDCPKSPRTLPSSCITTPCNQKCPPPPPSPCIIHVGESPPLKPLPGKSPPCKSPQCKTSPCNPSPYHLFPSDSPSRKSPPCNAPLRKLPPRRPPPSLESSSRKSPERTTPPMCTSPPSTAPPCKSSTFRSPQCMSTPIESLLLETQQKTSPSDKRKPYKTLMTVMSPMTPQACRSPRGSSAPRASHPSVHMLSNAKKYQQCAPSPPAKKSSGYLCTPVPACAVPTPPCDPSSPRPCKKARPDCQLFSPPCLIQCLKKTDNDELWDEIEETYDSSPCSMPRSCLPEPSCDSNLPRHCKKARPDCQPPPCFKCGHSSPCSTPPSCLPEPSCDSDLPLLCKEAYPDCQPPPCFKCGHSPPCSTPPSCLPEPSCDPDLPRHCKKARPDCHPPPCLKCGYSPPCSTPLSCLPEPPCDSDLPPLCKEVYPDCQPPPCLKCGHSPPCSTPPPCLPEPSCDPDLPRHCKKARLDCHPPPCFKCGHSPPCSTPPSCLPEPPCDSDLPPLCKEAYPDCQPPPCFKCGHSPPCSTPPSCLPEPSCDSDLPPLCKEAYPDCQPPPCFKCGHSPPCSTPPSCLPEPSCDPDLPRHCKKARQDCHPPPCLKCGYSPPCSTPLSCLPEPPCDSDLPPLCKKAYPDCQPPPCFKCGHSPPCSTPPSCLPEPPCDSDLPPLCKKAYPDCQPPPCFKCGHSPPCSTPPSCLPEPPCDSDLPPLSKEAYPDCQPPPCFKCSHSPPCSPPPSCLPEPPCDSDLPPLCKEAYPDCQPPPCFKCGHSPPCLTPPSCLPEPPCDSDLRPLCKEAYPDCQPPPCFKYGHSPPCSTPPSCLPEPSCDSDLPPLCKEAYPDCHPPPCLKCGYSPPCSTPPSCLPEPPCDSDLPALCNKARPACQLIPPPCLTPRPCSLEETGDTNNSCSCSFPSLCQPTPPCELNLPPLCKKARPDCQLIPLPCKKCGHLSPCSTPPSCLPEPPCDSDLPPLCKKARLDCQLIPPPCLTPRPCSLEETETEETGDTNNSCSCSFPSLCPPTPPCELNLPPLCKKAHPDCQLIPPPCLNTPPCSTPPSCLPEPSCYPDLPQHCKKARPDCQPPPCKKCGHSSPCSTPPSCLPEPPCDSDLPPLCKKARPDCQQIPPPCLTPRPCCLEETEDTNNSSPCSMPPSCIPEPSCDPNLPPLCKKALPDCLLIPPPCLKHGQSCLKKTSLTLLDGSCKKKNKKPPCKEPPCKRGSEAHLARSESSHDFVQETCLTQEEKDNYPWPTNQKSNPPSPRRGSLIKLNSNSEKNSSNLSQPDSSSQQKQNKKSTPKKSKMSGLHLVMKPCEKKRYTEAYYSSSEDIKNNDGRIKIKLKSPSSSTEEVNIKVRDADGQTLYETRNYCAENKATLNNPMYRDSNYNRPMVFTNVTETQVEKDLVKDKSDSSIPNLIEIQLKLRIAQVNKTTEFNIENDNGTELVKSDNGKKSPEVYIVKNETEAKNSAENSKNDMSIKIVVRNYKQKQQIYGIKRDDDLSKKNSNKCHTVSTCYSDLVGMPDDGQVISIHRATINLSSSTEKTSTENIQCCENCTENDEVIENRPSHSIEQLLTEDENIDEKTMSSLKDSRSEKFAETNTDETKSELPDFNDTDEQDATLLGATSSEYNVDFDLPTPKEEKKALRKKVIQKEHRTQGKGKVAVRQLRNMLKILTDSSDNEHDFKTGSNELAKDVTYTSLKPNYFRDTDSMTNYYQLDSNFSSKHGNLKERASEERSDSDANDITFQGCMCSKVAAKLNDCKMNVSCCCRNKLKKNEETNCDIRNEEDLNLLNYNTEYVNVETQNSKYFASKANSFSVSVHSKQVSAKIIEDLSVERHETNNTVNMQKRSTNVYPMHRRHIKESNMKKNKQNSVLGILDDDRVLVLRDRSRRDVKTVRNKYETHRETTTTIFEADILQSYETKKAVLEIYAEKTKHGEHLVAKLPKFVYDRENEIANNQEQIAANSYKTVCKQNIVMMSLR